MRYAALALLPILAMATSCGGGGASTADEPLAALPQEQAATAPQLPSDTETISKLYNPYYSVPDEFFVDERASTAQSYTVHHIMDESQTFELCADDLQSAEAWEAADNAARSVSGYYVGAYENERYFEFIRELSYDDDVGNIDDLTSPGYARVFKCSNTERAGVDRSRPAGYAGTLNRRPLDDASIRDFSEYLWQFAFFPQRYKKVLDSYPVESSDGPAHTLLLGFASTQGIDRCDRVDVVEWKFQVDRDTGRVESRFETVRSFEAEVVEGSPRLCL